MTRAKVVGTVLDRAWAPEATVPTTNRSRFGCADPGRRHRRMYLYQAHFEIRGFSPDTKKSDQPDGWSLFFVSGSRGQSLRVELGHLLLEGGDGRFDDDVAQLIAAVPAMSLIHILIPESGLQLPPELVRR